MGGSRQHTQGQLEVAIPPDFLALAPLQGANEQTPYLLPLRYINYFFDNLDYLPIQLFCQVWGRRSRARMRCRWEKGSCLLCPHSTPTSTLPPAHRIRSQACLDCRGVVMFTGVGKSGLIAQKICQTLVSTGTKAVFLSPQVRGHASGCAPCRSSAEPGCLQEVDVLPTTACCPPFHSCSPHVAPTLCTHPATTAGRAAWRHWHPEPPGPAGVLQQERRHRGAHPPGALCAGGWVSGVLVDVWVVVVVVGGHAGGGRA